MRLQTWRVFDRVLASAIVVMFLLFGFGGILEHRRTDRLIRQGAAAHDAICTLRFDLQRRANVTRNFLEAHPAGFGGFDVDTIRNSLVNQEQTIHALSGIHCRTEGVTP